MRRDGSDETAVSGGVWKRGVVRKWWKTYSDGKVEGQPNTSEIGGRERQSLLRQQVFGCRIRSQHNGSRVLARGVQER